MTRPLNLAKGLDLSSGGVSPVDPHHLFVLFKDVPRALGK